MAPNYLPLLPEHTAPSWLIICPDPFILMRIIQDTGCPRAKWFYKFGFERKKYTS